jgi:hypothetical protein
MKIQEEYTSGHDAKASKGSRYPIVSDDPSVQAHYKLCREQGTSDSLALMFAFQRGPTLFTDDTFRATFGVNGEQFAKNPKRGDALARNARRNGVNVKGKIYIGQLNRHGYQPGGDPEAWIDGRGDIQRLLKKRGHGGEQTDDPGLRIKAVEKPPDAPIPLAEDIVRDIARRKIAKNPSLKKMKKQELREQIIEKHGRKK